MALPPESKQSNLVKSLTAWFRANLVTIAGLTVVFGAEPVDTRPGQWVVIDYLFGVRHGWGGIVGTRYGAQAHGFITLNLCINRDTLTNVYAMAALRDTVATYVQRGQVIPLKDYDTGGTPTIGAICCGESTEAVVDDGTTTGLLVHAISVACTYTEAWALV
jgi:hypothetical protein